MAVTVFSKQNGMVISFPDPAMPSNTTLNVEGWDGFTGFKSIITRVNISSQGNFQFLHTLGGNIFVYVFGDRMGQMGISGLAFESTCSDPAGQIGIEHVINYYNQNRLAARATPIKVTIGTSTTIPGYMAGIAADVQDTKNKIYQFNLQLMITPDSGTECTPLS